MATLLEIRPVKQNFEAELLNRQGVTGVDIGYKIVGGKKTPELSIRVLVQKKKKDVSAKEKIPDEIGGIKTDVIERRFIPQPRWKRVADLAIHADTGNYDPVRGGVSIGPCRSIFLNEADAACHDAPGPGSYFFVGTLGAIVHDNATGAEMLLSNFHVMCVNDAWSVGDTMAQPSRVDGGGCPADVVGSLQRAVLGGQVDCAVASHTARGVACSIVDIGDVAGTAAAAIGMPVRKRGRTTGLTYGVVDLIDLTVNIDYCDGLGTVTLINQIGIEVDSTQSPQFGNGGDSGSVVVDGSQNVVGLYFAGTPDGQFGAANPIDAVLSALNVSLCVTPKKREPDVIKKFEPDTKKHEPDIKKREPDDIKKHEPDTKKHEPDIKKREPDDIKKHEPDTKKHEPDIKKREPDDIKKFEPDTKKHEPDIKKNEPDIKKNEPDTKKHEPDIKKNEPDTKKHEPDIKKNEPDTKKHEPDIKKNEPDTKKHEPDIKKNEPDTKKHEPDIKKNEPDTKKHEPDIKKNEPDIKKHEPDIKKNEPDTKKHEPDIKKNEPDIKKNEPDIKKNEPDIKKQEPDIKKNEPDKGQPEKFEREQPPVTPGPMPVEERLSRIEAALAQLTHFIRPELRPEVEKAPLRYEGDKDEKDRT